MEAFDVIVAGSGPTGMMLAHELSLAGVRVAILEKSAERSDISRAFTMQPRTAEVLDLRGLLRDVHQRALATVPDGHFGGLPVKLKYDSWWTRHPYVVGIGQAEVEALIEQRLAQRGLNVRYGHEVTGLRQDTGGVTVEAQGPGGPLRFRSRYLIGCDGGRSVIRKQLGIGFPGTEPSQWGIVADVMLERTEESVPRRWASNTEMFGSRASMGRLVVMIPLDVKRGAYRMGVIDANPEARPADRDAPVTIPEVEAILRTQYGPDIKVAQVNWASRYTDASRQAEQYRMGRAFLAGDAAHIHTPASGQGMNLGIQDAMNLGWKLASAINGWTGEALLDSYHDERHPVAAQVLEHTRAQSLFQIPTEDPKVIALRNIFIDVMKVPGVVHHLAGLISGFGIRYPMAGADDAAAHPLLGMRMPDLELIMSDASRCWFSDMMNGARGLLLTGSSAHAEVAGSWSDRIDIVPVAILPLPGGRADAVLIRADGYICWIAPADGGPASAALPDVLEQWFGHPARQ